MCPTGVYYRSEELKQKCREQLDNNRPRGAGSFSEEHKQKLAVAQLKRTDRRGHPLSQIHRDRIRIANTGKTRSEASKKKQSASLQGLSITDWKGYISFEPYCSQFNRATKERIRNQYLRTCVISGDSSFQIGEKLSVHHVDNNKQQGCEGIPWRLVPITRSWNAKLQFNNRDLLLNLLLINNDKAQINYED